METQSVPSDNGGGPPTLAVAGVVRAVCLTCAYTWTGAAAEQPAGCPHDGRALVVTAATGETIEQAIAAAVQELPERVEPVQPTIPGLRPAFDLAAALDSIEDAEVAASKAEREYANAAESAKLKRKRADDANTTLRDLIRNLNERRHDARYEPAAEDSEATADVQAGGVQPEEVVRRDVPSGEEGQQPDRDHRDAADGDVQAVQDPEPVIDCSNAATLDLLHRAGADQITRAAVDAWTEAQYTAARAWALEQIEATAHDEPGHHTSVYWPEHVSLAHHGPPTHTPKKRAKQKTSRRRAR